MIIDLVFVTSFAKTLRIFIRHDHGCLNTFTNIPCDTNYSNLRPTQLSFFYDIQNFNQFLAALIRNKICIYST